MTEKKIIAYKGFDKDLKCRGFQYAVGETYTHDGKVEPCKSGLHSCKNPWDVLDYYDINSRFAIVITDGEIKTHVQDSKIASSKLTIEAELNLSDFISKCIDYINDICKSSPAALDTNSGSYRKLASSVNFSQLASSGYCSQLASSGYCSQLASSGNYSKLSSSGDYSKLASSGNSSQLASSGDNSIISICGVNGRAKGGKNCALSLSRWVESEKRYRISVAYVGENGIKQDTWYMLDDDGNFVECE